jgi:hypothetical protein
MTDEEKEDRSRTLKAMMESPAGKILIKHIDDEMKAGWDHFIALPVSQKTNKAAFNYQAQYEVLRNLKDWIDSEIRVGEDLK